MKPKFDYVLGRLVYTEHHHKSRIGTEVGSVRPNGYRYYNNRLVHRMVWEHFYGAVPDGYFVDHVDGDVTNNTLDNLRLVTPHQSSANRGPMKVRELPKGVRMFRGKYRAQLDNRHLGTFTSLEDAMRARTQAESEYHRKVYYK